MYASASLPAAIAAHRFGLGEPSLAVVGDDPRQWLEAQIGPADAAVGASLASTSQALQLVAAERARRQLAKDPAPGMTPEQAFASHYRESIVADARSRLVTAMTTQRPFAERLQLFWSNHFTVSLAKGSARGLVGAFEREAIRPRIAGSFEELLVASTTHPAMLRYLDNNQSAGPHSLIVARAARRAAMTDGTPRVTGLNENLARELLELHTLGAESGRGAGSIYTQDDVIGLAGVLTGWRVDPQRLGASDPDTTLSMANLFDANWHEPGRKTVLGKSYPEGPEALRRVLHDLAQHPATARFVSTKLARHFVADEPPAALVDRLAATYLANGSRLAPVYRQLIADPSAWDAQPAKLKTPEEFVISSARLLRADPLLFDRSDGAGLLALGQRVQSAPSPAGWSDRAADWLGPDAVWKRIEWSTRTAARVGGTVDARALASQSLGPLLGPDTERQLARAADGAQAMALLLMAPEFQRR